MSKQIIINFKDNESWGGADCPFCNSRSTLDAKNDFIYIKNFGCSHANMAVDAGNFQTAIHFESVEV